jgi:hypothetical protein
MIPFFLILRATHQVYMVMLECPVAGCDKIVTCQKKFMEHLIQKHSTDSACRDMEKRKEKLATAKMMKIKLEPFAVE